MADDSLFAEDFAERPHWWELAAPEACEEGDLPATADVAIVGSGYTALVAAVHLARAGRSVLVLEAAEAGHGASRRNAGYLGRTLKRSFTWLESHHGAEFATRVYRELDAARQWVWSLTAELGIDCHIAQCGRFIAATSEAHYNDLARELETMRRRLDFPYEMVAPADVRRELASDAYVGGAVIPDLGSIHPALYHRGLLQAARAAGVRVFTHTPVTDITRDGKSAQVTTPRWSITAREAIIATNGYTPRHLSWLARRVVPFEGFMAATEELSPALMAKIIPNGRTVVDSNVNINFFRPAPDQRKILFGGLTGSRPQNLRDMAARLHAMASRLLPDLAQVRLSRVWKGQCAGTFDFMPHIGRHEGLWYALGYNFAGVPMGSYLGFKLAQQMLGKKDGESVFAATPFPTLPFYTGNPWFVPIAMRWFDWKDAWVRGQKSDVR
ncbi:NAD(P)/FAD-dependent oxidoreductase [Dongia deserti]|uniref:NAD(P)/FAD-dependent oxidoreductase n=1 Tax=Dongia deserti TaxID=2268030 RepID=UPI000E65DE5B|nr:FAD-binding oxidoreductase [Dongia deserti]